MYTASFIRRHIFRLAAGQLFTTRELLSYGRRSAVDQTLYRLVKSGVIIRLARGVFVRDDLSGQPVSAWQVATVKAQSFSKKIASYGGDLARQLGLLYSEKGPEQNFCVNGSSSSFRFGSLTINLRKSSARRLCLGESPAGQALRALWHLGRSTAGLAEVTTATSAWGHRERKEARQLAVWLPAWTGSFFVR